MAQHVLRERKLDQLIPIVAFVVFLLLWVIFTAALVANQAGLDATWNWVGEQNVVVRVALWLLLLPVMAGLWVWESGWPLIVRLVIVGGIALVNLYVFFPRFLLGGRG